MSKLKLLKHLPHDLAYWLTIRPRLNVLQKLLPEAHIYPTGSRYVCNPPVIGTDIDFLVYSKKFIDKELEAAGFVKSPFTEYNNSANQVDDFNAWRKGVLNLIVTSSVKYAENFHTATHICKTHNIRDKHERVFIHEAVRGNLDEFRTYEYNSLKLDIRSLLTDFNGPYGLVLRKAYRAQHDLRSFS